MRLWLGSPGKDMGMHACMDQTSWQAVSLPRAREIVWQVMLFRQIYTWLDSKCRTQTPQGKQENTFGGMVCFSFNLVGFLAVIRIGGRCLSVLISYVLYFHARLGCTGCLWVVLDTL